MNYKNKLQHKQLYLIWVVVFLLGLGSVFTIVYPVYGQTVTNPLDSIDDEISEIENDIEDEINDFLDDTIDSIIGPIAGVFNDLAGIVGEIETFLDGEADVDEGALGIPDLESAKVIFTENEDLNRMSDLFGSQTTSTVALKDKLFQQYIRELSQEYSENNSLSEEGQEKIAQKIEIAAQTVEASAQLANDSSSQDVSQNILRNISNQLSLQQEIDNMLLFEMQEDKIGQGLNLQMSAEALSEVSKQTTREERQHLSQIRASLSQNLLISLPGQGLQPEE